MRIATSIVMKKWLKILVGISWDNLGTGEGELVVLKKLQCY